MEQSAQITDLANRIAYHKNKYYAGEPELSDREFDALENQLRKLDPNHIILTEVGADVQSTFKKVIHTAPMLSLENCYNREEFDKWVARVPNAEQQNFIVMPKLDGFAVSIMYQTTDVAPDDVRYLTQGLTRGDGKIGEDVTENVKQIKGIPTILAGCAVKTAFLVRGECVMPKAVFKSLVDNGAELKTARNAAAGAIRSHDPRVVAERGLCFMPYNVVADVPLMSTALHQLELMGFNVVQWKSVRAEDVEAVCQSLEQKRGDLDYEIDGLVIAVDDLSVQLAMGNTDHHPKAFIAWKFEAEYDNTVLRQVEWQVSRTGRITPVAIFDPIELGGVTVARANLFNLSEIERLGVQLGSYIVVSRQGDVVPQVREASAGVAMTLLMIPNVCPVCGGASVIQLSDEQVKTLYCTNTECPAVLSTKIEHYVKCMDIVGVGPALIDNLVELGLVAGIPDLYALQIHDFMQLPHIQDRAARKLYNAIHANTGWSSLSKFLWAIGIPGVGKVTAEALADKAKDIGVLVSQMPDYFKELSGIEEKTANAIVVYLQKPETLALINALTDYNVNGLEVSIPILHFGERQSLAPDVTPLMNQTFLITGTLSVSRKEFEQLITDAGGKIASSVTKKLDYLIVGVNAGSKYDKAKSLGVSVLSENDAHKLIGDGIKRTQVIEEGEKIKQDAEARYEDTNFQALLKEATDLVEWVLENHPKTRSSDNHKDIGKGLIVTCEHVIDEYDLGIEKAAETFTRMRRLIQNPQKDKAGNFQPGRLISTPIVYAGRLAKRSQWESYLGYVRTLPLERLGYNSDEYKVFIREVGRLYDKKMLEKMNKGKKTKSEPATASPAPYVKGVMGGL